MTSESNCISNGFCLEFDIRILLCDKVYQHDPVGFREQHFSKVKEKNDG